MRKSRRRLISRRYHKLLVVITDCSTVRAQWSYSSVSAGRGITMLVVARYQSGRLWLNGVEESRNGQRSDEPSFLDPVASGTAFRSAVRS